jgi:iron-sulfur cluster insertion protein
MEQFRLSPGATRRVAEILSAEQAAASGYQYKFDLTQIQGADDLVIERDGARVFVDPVSLDLLAGAELDYTDSLMGAHFAVKNPQATSSCGCGTSFSID